MKFSLKTLLGAVGIALGLATSGASAAETPAELRIGYQKYGTLVILKERGVLEERFADRGIKVRWTEFPAGPQMLEALNVGSVDFGTVGETPPVFAQAADADLVYVAHQPPAPTAEAIIVHKDSPIKTVADLKGKRVALNKGSNVHFLLVRALEDAGLSIRDIRPAYLPPADARAAFERGSVDAWVIWDPFLAAAEDALEARTLRNGSGLVNNHEFYIAARPLAEKYPHIVKEIVEELQELDRWAIDNPRAIAKTLAPSTGLAEDVIYVAATRANYGARYLSDEVIEQQQTIADTFSDLKLIPKKLDIPSVVWKP
jgi:sulfonate transport system substrate-binding protein